MIFLFDRDLTDWAGAVLLRKDSARLKISNHK